MHDSSIDGAKALGKEKVPTLLGKYRDKRYANYFYSPVCRGDVFHCSCMPYPVGYSQ